MPAILPLVQQLQDPDVQQIASTLSDPQLMAGRLLGGTDRFPNGAVNRIPSCPRIVQGCTFLTGITAV